jgi:peptide deformylase
LCNPDDFEIFINPTIHARSEFHELDWEYCLSFPNTRCSVRRSLAIRVSYIDEYGNIIEQELKEFNARVFLK